MRAQEIAAALSVLGVKHHEFLGYRDSGMMGTEANDHPNAFWRADFIEATKRLVALIRRYQPEVMTVYDPFGGYGHPDHINVHRVGVAAFFGARDLGWFPLEEDQEYWAPSKLYWTTWGRERTRKLMQVLGGGGRTIPRTTNICGARSGAFPMRRSRPRSTSPSSWVSRWRLSRLTAPRSPMTGCSCKVPEAERSEVYGTETFVRVFSSVESALPETDLFAGLR